jgi:hypothetical protein
MNVWDNHKFQITAVHLHGAESVILVHLHFKDLIIWNGL